jgi:hypothetical protein
MNPAVFADPQVIPQLVPPRAPGRPTLYSPELIEEFCGLIVDGMTIDRACKEARMPSKRTIFYWLEQFPEFRHRYEIAVAFRNQCWMDDTVDIADDTKSDVRISITENGTLVARMVRENTAQRKVRIDTRWKQLNGMRLKTVTQPGDNARVVGGEKVVYHDPVHGQLYQWELEYQKRRLGRSNGHDSNGGPGPSRPPNGK